MIELYYVSLEATFFNPWLPKLNRKRRGSKNRADPLFPNSFARIDRDGAEVLDGTQRTSRVGNGAHRRVCRWIVRKNGVAFVLPTRRGTAAFVGTGEVPMEVLQRASEQPQ